MPATVLRDLRAIEALAPPLVGAGIFEDERPLVGVPSLIDFRLAGRLGAALRAGSLTGAAGERFLMPLGRRIAVPWLVLVGLGPRSGFAPSVAATALDALFDAADGLRATPFVLEPPGLAHGLLGEEEALALVDGQAPVQGTVVVLGGRPRAQAPEPRRRLR